MSRRCVPRLTCMVLFGLIAVGGCDEAPPTAPSGHLPSFAKGGGSKGSTTVSVTVDLDVDQGDALGSDGGLYADGVSQVLADLPVDTGQFRFTTDTDLRKQPHRTLWVSVWDAGADEIIDSVIALGQVQASATARLIRSELVTSGDVFDPQGFYPGSAQLEVRIDALDGSRYYLRYGNGCQGAPDAWPEGVLWTLTGTSPRTYSLTHKGTGRAILCQGSAPGGGPPGPEIRYQVYAPFQMTIVEQ